jgi:dTDP-4-amino-4,6-dideoxygalactose transaminase
MQTILELGRRYNLKIIEDCAQALSAEHKGQKVGAIGDAGCFSFFPAKNLGAFGDGGAVITNDAQIAESVRMLRVHGAKTSYYHTVPGFTSRLDAIQAAILRVKLKHLDTWSSLRRQRVSLYTQLLGDIRGIEPPFIWKHNVTSANYYTVRLHNHHTDRNELRKYLSSKGIETAVYYPLSLHLQEAYIALNYQHGDFPETELAQEEVLSFPLYPEIKPEQVVEVTESVKEYLRITRGQPVNS